MVGPTGRQGRGAQRGPSTPVGTTAPRRRRPLTPPTVTTTGCRGCRGSRGRPPYRVLTHPEPRSDRGGPGVGETPSRRGRVGRSGTAGFPLGACREEGPGASLPLGPPCMDVVLARGDRQVPVYRVVRDVVPADVIFVYGQVTRLRRRTGRAPRVPVLGTVLTLV